MADPGPFRPIDMLDGGRRRNAIIGNHCSECGGFALSFSDEVSQTEYLISGMCQNCQDLTFAD